MPGQCLDLYGDLVLVTQQAAVRKEGALHKCCRWRDGGSAIGFTRLDRQKWEKGTSHVSI